MQLDSQFQTTTKALTVSELNQLARNVIERELPLLWVRGEISNCVRSAAGHCYFSLKDRQAQVRCVMFRQKIQLQEWLPADGMQVEVRACPSFYEARGEFQLSVELMRRFGSGALYEAFAKLKAKLQSEGLFDSASKRAIPRFPRAIGIVTSLRAAALHDVLTVLSRRMPGLPVIIYPTAVQGDGASGQIVAALKAVSARAECDVVIVCRGGGSIEDLWAFNDEAVARAMRACPMPTISAIGHETDFTIADFIADLRAATPTAAAQKVSPDRTELMQQLNYLQQRLLRVFERHLERRMQHLDLLEHRLIHPIERIARNLAHLGHLATRMRAAWAQQSAGWRWRLREHCHQLDAIKPKFDALAVRERVLSQRLMRAVAQRLIRWNSAVKSYAAQLEQLSPHAVLARGYSIVESSNGEVVRDSAQVRCNDTIRLTFARGRAAAQIIESKPDS